MLRKKWFKKLVRLALTFFVISLIFIGIANTVIEKSAVGRTFSSVDSIPHHKVGLVLGTSKFLQNGTVNLYYKYRVDATVALYKTGKIDYVIVSGDNSTKEYDEPSTFKEDLIKGGIPEERIYLDYAGFRTLDSVVRVKEIFGQESVVIISQQFHNERAIYLAEHYGIKAIGYNAKNVSKHYGFKTNLREYLARTKVFIDILLGVQPKFLGEKIVIPS
ncbi:MAG: ElyC/SanA/YdcF family protein [Flavobacteriaceae bacterium]|nr:YdcF family protein [Flavobacteriaceae bacterium]MCB0486373.1 YdcF family protein [Flavobacteriaceae bacterium]